MEFRDWLFNHLPKAYRDKDSYKDPNGEGVLKRYLRLYGLELDENFWPFMNNFIDLIDVMECDDKFLPLIGSILGYPPTINTSTDTYRKILLYAVAIYKIKGTKKSFQILFNLLGLEMDIIEDMPRKKIHYDKPFTYYDDEWKYDSHCDYCSGYHIIYNSVNDNCITGTMYNVPKAVLNSIPNIICFLNPINATFLGLIRRYKICDEVTWEFIDEVNFCQAPTELVITYTGTPGEYSVAWTGGPAQIRYREIMPTVTGYTTVIGPVTSPHIITGLELDRIYEFGVRKQCTASDFSSWVNILLNTYEIGLYNNTPYDMNIATLRGNLVELGVTTVVTMLPLPGYPQQVLDIQEIRQFTLPNGFYREIILTFNSKPYPYYANLFTNGSGPYLGSMVDGYLLFRNVTIDGRCFIELLR